MLQQARPRQVSPLSMVSNDSTILNKYQSMSEPYDASRGQNASPPLSYPSGSDGHSRSASSRSPGGSQISSASSVARSSGGNGMYSPVQESHRTVQPRHEEALLEHYRVLRTFLGPFTSHDSQTKSTRARDKLSRLSPTQFHELSTDIYDEHLRRDDERRRRGQDVPRHLLPTPAFHPKRNQARQKLSILPPEKFSQLATDVYYELECRVPKLGGYVDRAASPALSTASSYRGPPRGPPPNMRGPPGPPGPPGSNRGPPGRGPPDRSQYPARVSSHDYGKPLPKTFQSNTIVPNKSTMVEGDDTDDEDIIGMSVSSGSPQKRNPNHPQNDDRVAQLEIKMAQLESALADKDSELKRSEAAQREQEQQQATNQEDWDKERQNLERKIAELENATRSHGSDLDQALRKHATREADLQEQMDQTITDMQKRIEDLNNELTLSKLQGGSQPDGEWQERCQKLEGELAMQQRTTEEVRENAAHFLQEMRTLSEQSEAAVEREERLQRQISTLEVEVGEWKSRYAKTRTELRTLKASSIGLSLQNLSQDALATRQHFLSTQGLVNDMDVTGFQISIDELLQSARKCSAETTLDKMKVVIQHVQQITAYTKNDYTGLPSPADSPNPMSPQLNGTRPTSGTLKARVSRNATGLITATRNFVTADGLSPVSLVDAAAANLTAAVVDYVKTVGIKASSSNDLGFKAPIEEDDCETLSSAVHVQEPQKKVNPDADGAGINSGWHSRLKGSFDSNYSNDVASSSLRDDESDYDNFR